MKMLFIKQEKNANGFNNKGFTMVEMLFSFSVFCIAASFLPLMFNILFHSDSIDARIQKMEWELFVNQLKKEIQTSDNVNVVNGELILINAEETISFGKYKNILRRRVDGKGHEVVLQNVKEIQFEVLGRAVLIETVNTFEQTSKVIIYQFVSP